MSQINTYEGVTYPGTVTATQAAVPLAGLLAGAITECGRVAGQVLFPSLQEGDRVSFASVNVSAGLAAPAELNAAWQELLAKDLSRIDVLTRMAGMAVRYEQPAELMEAAQAYMMADTSNEQNARVQLVQLFRQQHTGQYITAVEGCVRAALQVVGLRVESETPNGSSAQLAGHTSDGRLLRVKVLQRTDGRIALETSTHGFQGRTCQVMVDSFHAALEMKGLSLGKRDCRWTGEACEIPAKQPRKSIVRTYKNPNTQKQ